MTRPNLAYIQLLPAMHQPGCPICRISEERAADYLRHLLSERMMDGDMYVEVASSLGYCEKHTWKMGLIELLNSQESVKNSMIYEQLIKSMVKRLSEYERIERHKENGITTTVSRSIKKQKEVPTSYEHDPYHGAARQVCAVCQVETETSDHFLKALVTGLAEEEDDLRNAYVASDGLCLIHFRQVFPVLDANMTSGARFLVEETIVKLNRLRGDLSEYINKHSWDRCYEKLSDGERTSWLRALRFFGTNEENLLIDKKAINELEDKQTIAGV